MSAWAGCAPLFFSCLADRRTTVESGMLNRVEEDAAVSDDSRKLGPVRFGPRAQTLCSIDHRVNTNGGKSDISCKTLDLDAKYTQKQLTHVGCAE